MDSRPSSFHRFAQTNVSPAAFEASSLFSLNLELMFSFGSLPRPPDARLGVSAGDSHQNIPCPGQNFFIDLIRVWNQAFLYMHRECHSRDGVCWLNCYKELVSSRYAHREGELRLKILRQHHVWNISRGGCLDLPEAVGILLLLLSRGLQMAPHMVGDDAVLLVKPWLKRETSFFTSWLIFSESIDSPSHAPRQGKIISSKTTSLVVLIGKQISFGSSHGPQSAERRFSSVIIKEEIKDVTNGSSISFASLCVQLSRIVRCYCFSCSHFEDNGDLDIMRFFFDCQHLIKRKSQDYGLIRHSIVAHFGWFEFILEILYCSLPRPPERHWNLNFSTSPLVQLSQRHGIQQVQDGVLSSTSILRGSIRVYRIELVMFGS